MKHTISGTDDAANVGKPTFWLSRSTFLKEFRDQKCLRADCAPYRGYYCQTTLIFTDEAGITKLAFPDLYHNSIK